MAAYVRVKDRAVFAAYVEAYGESQVVLAARCGLSSQRMSQLVTGKGPVIRATYAARIEDELHVSRGFLFAPDEPELIKEFVDGQIGARPFGESADEPAEPITTQE